MSTEIFVPDIGDFENVEIIEILAKPGDVIKKNDPILFWIKKPSVFSAY